MIQKIDVLIESNQPGFLETLGFDPRELLRRNPKLIICRISGYGQTGSFSKKAGQDINFLATSGLLSTFGTKENHPEFPGNIMVFFFFRIFIKTCIIFNDLINSQSVVAVSWERLGF